MTTIRFLTLIAVGALIWGCTNPLNSSSYSGRAAAEFSVGGEVYRPEWNINIRQYEKFGMADNYDAWQLAPSGSLVNLHDGSAVWIDGIYSYYIGSHYSQPIANTGMIVINALESYNPATLPARVYWMDKPHHPSVIKVTPWPCTDDFPIQDCKAFIRYGVENGYKGPSARIRQSNIKIPEWKAPSGVYEDVYSTSGHYERLPWLSSIGENGDNYRSFRFTYCKSSSWLGRQIKAKMQMEKIPPLQAIEHEGGAIIGKCERPEPKKPYSDDPEGTKWKYWRPEDVSAVALKGNNYNLVYKGNGVWALPPNPQKAISYYRMENQPPENDYRGMTYLRSIRGGFGEVSIPVIANKYNIYASKNYAFMLPNSDDIIIIMPLDEYF